MPSTQPTSHPSISPSTSSPTNSPVEFLGACPEKFETLLSYSTGAQVEVDNMIYECKSESCGSHWFGMVPLTSALLKQGWEGPVGSCLGTRDPTVSPTLSVSLALPLLYHHKPFSLTLLKQTTSFIHSLHQALQDLPRDHQATARR